MSNVGITTAKKLRNLNYTGGIIFTADSTQFAVDSYDVQALGYLLKPLNTDKFEMTMDRFVKDFTTNKYTVQNHSKFINIPYNEILYIESDNSKCILHKTDSEYYTIYKKHLNVIQNELNDRRFLRCHQSYLVNMDYIASGDKSFVLTNGDIVCIRQRNLKAIKDTYLEYISFKKD
jgi:DNA-binding LytR/AlgR family response regulator